MITAALMLALFAGCGGGQNGLTAKEAEQIVLEDAGLSADDVSDIHTHAGGYENTSVYEIHLTVGAAEYKYLIDAETGAIIYADEIS